jgi:hypothetical protein
VTLHQIDPLNTVEHRVRPIDFDQSELLVTEISGNISSRRWIQQEESAVDIDLSAASKFVLAGYRWPDLYKYDVCCSAIFS